jgi:hypothetical protein
LTNNAFSCTWSAVPGATGYGIELLSAPPQSSRSVPDPHRIGVGVTSNPHWHCDSAGLPAGAYWYRVIAWSGRGFYGGFGAPDSFTVPKESLTIDLTDPRHPVFHWQAFPTATGYGVEILKRNTTPRHQNDTSSDPNRLAVGVTQAPTTRWVGDTTGLSAGTYVVRAIAWNANGFLSGFSDAQTITVGAARSSRS